MTDKMQELRNQAEQAKVLYKGNVISRKKAVEQIQPYADAFNEVSQRLAKKYNQRHKPFKVVSFLR